MKKVFMVDGVDYTDKLYAKMVKEDIRIKGHELLKFPSDADIVIKLATEFKEVGSKLANSNPEKENFVIQRGNKRTIVYKRVNRDSESLYVKTYKEAETVKSFVNKEQLEKLQKDLINYLVGKTNELNLVDPIPFNIVYPLLDIHKAMGTKRTIAEREQAALMKKWDLDKSQIEIISNEVKLLSGYSGNSEVLSIFRHIKMVWTGMAVGTKSGLILPNNSDNVIINLVQARLKALFYQSTKDDKKKRDFSAAYHEKIGNAVKTAKNSLFGTNKGFMTYARAMQRQLGVYGLFIYDDSLADGEVLIPNPKHMNLNSTKSYLKINGEDHEVLFLHARKTILINGKYADKARMVYANGFYSNYTVECNEEIGTEIKEYPSIGDSILVTRHPITTMLPRLEVTGYTNDCSIRVNSKTALAFYADSDGDSFSISWSRWSDTLKFHGVKEINEFCRIAGIDVDDNVEYKNEFDMSEFVNLVPATYEENAEKLDKSGLEQAEAKLMTAEETGKWGAVERDLVTTLILNGIKVDMAMIYFKSLLSQVLVQAKNILAKLQSGEGLDDEVKETIVLYSYMIGSPLKAAPAVAKLLDIPTDEARDLITTLRGERVIATKQETEENFLEEHNDIAYMR